MHNSSYKGMEARIAKYCADLKDLSITVLDVGSMDVNGSYKTLMRPGWKYIGADVRNGKNVDLCMKSEYDIPLESNSVDLVISGQCLEHCRNPFRLVREAARTLKPAGMMFLVAPFIVPQHREPIDCFRFLPDGLLAIFAECGIDPVEVGLDSDNGTIDCFAVGRKPCT